jgi:glycerol-3-phosphate cytidylyltransferase
MYVIYGGSFDLFHLGHLKALKRARKIADRYDSKLVITLNTDSLYKNYKDKTPIIPYKYRKEILESLREVDMVVPKSVFNDIALIKRFKPAVFLICREWLESKKEEIKLVKSLGGKTIILPYFKGISASEIRDKIIQNYRNHEKVYCDECHKRL